MTRGSNKMPVEDASVSPPWLTLLYATMAWIPNTPSQYWNVSPAVSPTKLLDELLPQAGLSRGDVYITNILKCRPPDNRDPLPEEIEACSRHLDIQLGHLNPELVITLGAFSLNRFFPKETVGKARGRLRNCNGVNVFPVMHPAAALRRGEFRARLTEDFRAIPQALADARHNPPEPESPAPARKQPVQPIATQVSFL